MKLEGSHIIGVPRAVVWSSMLDPDVLAAAIPGCRELQRVGEHRYEGLLNIRLGPMRGDFRGRVSLSELEEPESYHFELNGDGSASFVQGEGRVRLDEGGSGSTTVGYEMEVRVGGRIAGVGNRLLAGAATSVVRKSLASMEQRIVARSREGDGHGTADSPDG